MAEYDKYGREIPDNTPIEVPLRLRRPETMDEKMRRMIRELGPQLANKPDEAETFEEADDFDTGEGDEPGSIYELDDDPGPMLDPARGGPTMAPEAPAAAGPVPPAPDDKTPPKGSGEPPVAKT